MERTIAAAALRSVGAAARVEGTPRRACELAGVVSERLARLATEVATVARLGPRHERAETKTRGGHTVVANTVPAVRQEKARLRADRKAGLGDAATSARRASRAAAASARPGHAASARTTPSRHASRACAAQGAGRSRAARVSPVGCTASTAV